MIQLLNYGIIGLRLQHVGQLKVFLSMNILLTPKMYLIH